MGVRDMVLNATFNNISFITRRSVLLVEETGENHRTVASHWQLYHIMLYRVHLRIMGPSWSWWYVSWIYNYLYNQCLSPLKLWVRTSFMSRCILCNIIWQSLSVTCDRSVVSLENIVFLLFLKTYYPWRGNIDMLLWLCPHKKMSERTYGIYQHTRIWLKD
jgi:hypothetical protein